MMTRHECETSLRAWAEVVGLECAGSLMDEPGLTMQTRPTSERTTPVCWMRIRCVDNGQTPSGRHYRLKASLHGPTWGGERDQEQLFTALCVLRAIRPEVAAIKLFESFGRRARDLQESARPSLSGASQA